MNRLLSDAVLMTSIGHPLASMAGMLAQRSPPALLVDAMVCTSSQYAELSSLWTPDLQLSAT